MTEPGAAPTGAWRRATVRSVEHPSPRAVVLRLEVPDRIDHLPGQHYVIRLTADDGYVAQRSYSLASPPSDPLLEFYIERLDDGEVSTFLADVVEVGDELDVRGPIGGWFVWTRRPARVRRGRRLGGRAVRVDAAPRRGGRTHGPAAPGRVGAHPSRSPVQR